ncbi:VOC family protein [Desulfovibrio mangrovi]|uniref:VOC family protein n=1 Tax=Desulfovibrio mangrovi TaxID=2976983 RepID=UPI0022487178|nr:VOC family protein [Desulfovibrio mangrovi]UZP66911.1 VOC family protein [Desulfovibrio mangrovi]
MHISFEGPAIVVRSIPASRAFYENLMRQNVEFSVAEAFVSYTSKFSIWQESSASAMFHGQSKRLAYQPAESLEQFELYFETPDLDETWATFRQNEVPLVHDVVEQPWGQRCFRVKDPDGYVVELAEPMPLVVRRFLDAGMTVEEASKRTLLPVGIIESIVNSAE